MKLKMLSLALALALPAAAFAQDGAAKAQEVLKQARAAVGKEDKIKAMQNLVAEGNGRRMAGQRTIEGGITVQIVSPDKIRKEQSITTPQGDIVQIDVLNGAKVWNDVDSPFPQGGPGGGGMRGMFGGGGGGGFLDQAAQERNRRNDLTRVMLGWLLTAPSGVSVQYAYAGQVKAPDGRTADMIDVKDEAGLVARLYFDQESHQLLMLAYKDKDMRQVFGQRGPQGGGQAGPGGQGQPGGQPRQREDLSKLSPEEREKRQAEIREQQQKRQAEMKAAYEKAPLVDVIWNFSDYKSVNGLNLPHRLTKSTGGQATEEWEISKFKLNQNVKADKFEKKEKKPTT